IALYRLSSRVGDKQTRTADIRHRGSMVGPRPLDAFLHLAYVLHVAFRPNDSMNLRRYLRIVRNDATLRLDTSSTITLPLPTESFSAIGLPTDHNPNISAYYQTRAAAAVAHAPLNPPSPLIPTNLSTLSTCSTTGADNPIWLRPTLLFAPWPPSSDPARLPP
ncbi:hypothetical protein HN51_069568, partial [Arachis hypogaea]